MTIQVMNEQEVVQEVAGWTDPYRPITIDLKNAVCAVTPITAKEYCDFSPNHFLFVKIIASIWNWALVQ